MRYTASVTRDQDVNLFVAQCLELDVVSQGITEDEALANLREALELYLEGARADATNIHYIEIPSASSFAR